MFVTKEFSFNTSGVVNKLVMDYLDKEGITKNLYEHYPDLEGFGNILKNNTYQTLNRELLHNITVKQSKLVKNTSNNTLKNIELLKKNNTYTVTTGHQLCLFTGPLYFVYKILTTIKLAEELKGHFPENDFVPVYWMASEDHDFEEINHLHVFGKKLEWQTNQKGAVGSFTTEELTLVFEELKLALGNNETSNKLFDLFEAAYLKHNRLDLATRYLVNELFKDHGLIIIDGHDIEFKNQFNSFFKKDIFENTSFQSVQQTISYLNQNSYPIQVNPREINCFYIDQGERNRIEFKENQYCVVGSEIKFTKQELENLIDHHPEIMSPNVVLRPLYQQHILPNIAYVGGPGELAYWLEYFEMFKCLKVQFPILIPRNFISILDRSQQNKIEKLNLQIEDFFKSEKEIVDTFQVNSNAMFSLEAEKIRISEIYSTISERLNQVDKSLIGSLQAEVQKTLNGLLNVESKANKALKQKSETEINQIKGIKQKLYPNQMPQERYDNFSSYILKYGFGFIDKIKENIQPFIFNQKVLLEK